MSHSLLPAKRFHIPASAVPASRQSSFNRYLLLSPRKPNPPLSVEFAVVTLLFPNLLTSPIRAPLFVSQFYCSLLTAHYHSPLLVTTRRSLRTPTVTRNHSLRSVSARFYSGQLNVAWCSFRSLVSAYHFPKPMPCKAPPAPFQVSH